MIPFLVILLSLQSPLSEARSHSLKGVAKELAKDAREKIDDTNTVAPKDNEACFSPDENCSEKLRLYILSAKESLDIAIFDLNIKKIVDAIIDQSFKVRLRIIVNKKLSKDSSPAIERFKENRVLYRVGKQKGIMHNKFTIVDGKRLETGSFNYTNGASHANQENQVYLSTPSILERYKEHFNLMWEKAQRL